MDALQAVCHVLPLDVWRADVGLACLLQAAAKPLRTQEQLVADSAARLRGGGAAVADPGLAKRLRLKCTGHPDWSLEQVVMLCSSLSSRLLARP